MATLSNGTDVITPAAIDGFSSSAASGTVVNSILGSEDVAVLLRPATLATGTLSLVMGTDEAVARAAELALRGAHVWTLNTGGERDTVDMSFVVQGTVTRDLDPESREVWLIGFGWQEVNP